MTRGPPWPSTSSMNSAVDGFLTDTGSPYVRPVAAMSVAAGLARRPRRTARRVGRLGAELARVAGGRSSVRAGKRDRRFADPAWEQSWLFRRLMQTHLAVGEAVDGL